MMASSSLKDVTLHRILFICTSSRGDPSWSSGNTGLWLSELAIPLYTFVEVGYSVDIVTTKGGSLVLDDACLLPINMTIECENFLHDYGITNRNNQYQSLVDTISSKDIEKYGCIFLCGGHGAIDDFTDNNVLKEAIEYVYNVSNGVVAAVCHGSLGLLNCFDKAQKPLIKNKFMSVFSNEEEKSLSPHDDVDLPIYVETSVDELGATCIPGAPWRPNAAVDGRLVTGQNPQSSLQTAHRVLDVMRSLGDKYSPPGNVNKPWGH